MNSTVRGVPDLLPMTPAASARQRGTFPHHDVAPLSRRAFRPGRIAAAFLLAAFSLPLAPGASAESLSAEDLWNEHVGTGTDTTPPRIVSVQRTGDERERTSASTLGFDVTFSEPVHVDSGDLEIARSPGSWRRVQMNTGMHDDEMGRLKVAGDSYYKPCDPDEDRIRAHLDDGTASRLIERLDDECNRREQLSRHWHVLASGGAMSGAIHFEVDLVVAANHDMADIHGNRLDPTLPTGDHYQGYTIDRLRPTPLLSADVETHDGSTPFEVTVDFTRPVKGFRVDDLRTRNATIDELRGSDGDQEYFLTVTPQGTRDVGIRVRGYTTTRVWRGFRNRPSRNLIVRHKPTGVRDRAGNGNLAATQLSVPVDNTAPTPALSASPATHDGSSTSVVTIDFGEAVTGFAVGDIGVSRGSASGFTGDDGDSSYTVTVTPGGNADVGVSVAADVATDLAGNANLAAAAPLTVTYGATGATSATGAVTPVLGLTSRAGGVTLSTAALSVPEGSRNSYTAVLNEQPTANVTVSVARAAGGDADLTVSPASRTFTTSNWNTPQTFTVSAAREPRSDGFDIHPRFDSIDGTARFTHSVTSTDTNYDIADIAVLVATEDDADEHEVAWVFPSRNQGNDVGTGCLSEGGTTDAYQARLSALPGADVRVELHELFQDPVASGGGHIVAVDAAGQVLDALTFTPGNWNVPQRFFFSMPQDNDGETQDAAFELRATSTDADWHGLNGYDHIDICARDDDAIGWDITPREPSASEGTSVTYRIGPRTQPVGAIHLTLSVANEDAAGSVSPATVTFAHDDWAAKTVTVTFAADANAIDGTATVTHAPRSFTSRSGIDPSYTRPVPDVRVRETESSGAGGTEAPESGLAARFGTLPEWHAGMAFWTELHFSEAPHLGYKDVRDKLLEVTGGRLLSAQRLEQGNRSWRIEVLPAGFDDLELTLPATEDCAAEGAVCTADGERMEEPLSVTVPGPGERLAAKLTGFSTRHAGEPFEPELWFNHAPNISYRDVRDTLFEATGGRITRAKRQQQGSNLRWNLVVEPEAVGNLTLTLPATEDCAAPRAVCTQDGRKLARALSVTIEGPAAFSVSDAQVDEGSEAVLAFEVSLSRRLRAEARVDVATRDGTATAGADYEAVTQTLVFARGETVKTVEVAVLDDAHDEGEETMTLVLSNAEAAPIDDAEGTGTIVNSDAIPKAWIARFGRTVTGQVLDAVEGRLAAQRQAGMQATVAGYALPSWDGGATAQTAAQSEDRLAMAALGSWMARAGDGVNRFGSGDGFGAEGGLDQRTVSGRELLYGTSFALTAGSAEDRGHGSLWGHASVAGFDGREDALSLDGEVTTGFLGADWAAERWTAGLALGHSVGTGGYRNGECAGSAPGRGCGGRIEAELTGLYPYAGVDLNERVSVWLAGGHGAGALTVVPDGQGAIETDLAMSMGAAGTRIAVLDPEGGEGFSLALKGDGRFTRTSSDAASAPDGGNLAEAETDVWLLRFGVEGSRPFALGGSGAGDDTGASLTPSFEVGVRRDGGDAETGFGADMGGGVAFTAPQRGLRFDLKGRALVAHDAPGFREWGASAAFGFDPRPATERGLALSLTQSWGASPSGGMDALLGGEALSGPVANDDAGTGFTAPSRLSGELGYGLPAFGGGFTGTPNLGFGLSSDGARDWRLGWRLTSALRGGPRFEVSLDATRREGAGEPAEHGAMLTGRFRW